MIGADRLKTAIRHRCRIASRFGAVIFRAELVFHRDATGVR